MNLSALDEGFKRKKGDRNQEGKRCFTRGGREKKKGEPKTHQGPKGQKGRSGKRKYGKRVGRRSSTHEGGKVGW